MNSKNYTRRSFLKDVGLGISSVVMSSFVGSESLAKQKRQLPNIVYILADDMGYGDLACQNPQSKIPTPNLDELARQGTRFTDAHSGSAVCTPTRYGILTGRYCWRTRLKEWVLWGFGEPLIEPDRLTVGRLLQKQGYHTAAIGKWHLGFDWPTKDGKPQTNTGSNVDFTKPIKNGPLTRGFDYYFGVDLPNSPPYCYIENDRTIGVPSVPKPKDMFGWDGPMLAEGWDLEKVLPDLTEKAVSHIDKHAKGSPGKPLFLYFALTAPHAPVAPAYEFRYRTSAGGYGDFVFQLDWTVGEVVKALKRNGMYENTLIIFTSDNGSCGLDGYGMYGEINGVKKKFGHNPSRPWRGMKADAWEGGHRVPFIASWPGKIKPGTTCSETISLVDFMSTTAAIVGQKLPDNAGEDSYNILPALLGEEYEKPIREATVEHSGDGMFAIYQGEWKLIFGRGSGGFSKPKRIKPGPGEHLGQLYNLKEDPAEAKNLYQQRPDVVGHLTALLEKYKNQGHSRPAKKLI